MGVLEMPSASQILFYVCLFSLPALIPIIRSHISELNHNNVSQMMIWCCGYQRRIKSKKTEPSQSLPFGGESRRQTNIHAVISENFKSSYITHSSLISEVENAPEELRRSLESYLITTIGQSSGFQSGVNLL